MSYYGEPCDIAIIAAKSAGLCCWLLDSDKTCRKPASTWIDGYCYCGKHAKRIALEQEPRT